MRALISISWIFLALIVLGCTTDGDGGGNAVGGSGVTYETRSDGANLQGIEIRRIGNDQPRFREFQDRAIADALTHLENNGIERSRIENVTVDTRGGSVGGGLRVVRTAPRFTVWINVEGCNRGVAFHSSSTGRITRPSDPSDCLTPQP